jgi:uncharacterized protein YidB (DUF937 family)
MFDQLIQTAQQQLAPQLQEIGIKPNQVGDVFDVAKETVTDGFKSEATGGGLDAVMDLFNGNGGNIQSNSLVSTLSTSFVSSLVSKLGLDQAMAAKVSAVIIPFIMAKFSSSETGSASSPTDLISQLGFGDIGSSLGGMLGGSDKGGDLLGNLGKFF